MQVGEHPTQALLDLYTVHAEQAARGLPACGVVALVGDLKHGRTTHSLATLLARTRPGVALRLVSPAALAMPAEVTAELAARGCAFSVHESLDEVLADADVLYVTRVQKERFADPAECVEGGRGCVCAGVSVASCRSHAIALRRLGCRYELLKLRYVVTPETLAAAKPTLTLMHPLPRVGEISPDCDVDPRAAYFRQVWVGGRAGGRASRRAGIGHHNTPRPVGRTHGAPLPRLPVPGVRPRGRDRWRTGCMRAWPSWRWCWARTSSPCSARNPTPPPRPRKRADSAAN
jgi:hypothetical protein